MLLYILIYFLFICTIGCHFPKQILFLGELALARLCYNKLYTMRIAFQALFLNPSVFQFICNFLIFPANNAAKLYTRKAACQRMSYSVCCMNIDQENLHHCKVPTNPSFHTSPLQTDGCNALYYALRRLIALNWWNTSCHEG